MHNNILINADTDAILITKPDGAAWSEIEQYSFLQELNNQFPALIKFEHDGYFQKVFVLGGKNYILYDGKKIKTKGSSMKDQKKEPALKEMMSRIIEALVFDKKETLIEIYESYITEALHIKDITRWASKKTISESILVCRDWTEDDIKQKKLRKNETDIWDAIKDMEDLQLGNKVFVYPCILESRIEKKQFKNGKIKEKTVLKTGLKITDKWCNDHNSEKLIERVVSTLNIFNKILPNKEVFIDYTKKENKSLLEGLN